jgi:hypothetical protein
MNKILKNEIKIYKKKSKNNILMNNTMWGGDEWIHLL